MEMDEGVMRVLQALEHSKTLVPSDWDYLAEDEAVMEQVMEMNYMERPLSEHLSVPYELFPALEELEDDEVKLIVDKIIDVWAAYNYFADLPDNLPIRIAYTTLLNVWDDIVGCYPTGRCHFDFSYLDYDKYEKQLNSGEEDLV